MKKLFLLIAMTAFIASCTSKSTESAPSVDTTAVVMDSTMVDSILTTVEADTSL